MKDGRTTAEGFNPTMMRLPTSRAEEEELELLGTTTGSEDELLLLMVVNAVELFVKSCA